MKVEDVAAWMKTLSHWYVEHELTVRERALVDAYLAVKPDLVAGRLRIDRATDEQYAGLLIKIVNSAMIARRALKDAPIDMRKVRPGLDAILVEAVR